MKKESMLIFFLALSTATMGGYIAATHFKEAAPHTKSLAAKSPNTISNPKIAKAYQRTINKLISRENKKIQACYLDYQKKRPKAEGKVRYIFHVNVDGSINNIKIASSEFDSPFDQCTVNIMSKIHLNPPPSGMNPHISYTLNFLNEDTAKKQALERKKSQLEMINKKVSQM